MTDTLKGAAILGASTLGAALALQKFYEVTNFYPPKQVFWFFSGVTAFVALQGLEKATGKQLIAL